MLKFRYSKVSKICVTIFNILIFKVKLILILNKIAASANTLNLQDTGKHFPKQQINILTRPTMVHSIPLNPMD